MCIITELGCEIGLAALALRGENEPGQRWEKESMSPQE